MATMDQPEPDAPVHRGRRSVELHPSAPRPVARPAAHTAVHTAVHTGVRPAVHPHDARLRARLEQLLAEHFDDAYGIEVRVVDGVVTLRGQVSCPLAQVLAEDLAYTLPGVRECRLELTVIASGPVANA